MDTSSSVYSTGSIAEAAGSPLSENFQLRVEASASLLSESDDTLSEESDIIMASSRLKKCTSQKKFKETRHSVYRGVRRRNTDKWVCEVREPHKKTRIWLGTYPTAEMAARVHDVVALAFKGRSVCLNFVDLVWRLPVRASTDANDIRRAEAAEAFCVECSSHRVETPAPNCIRNGVRTRPHAPLDHRPMRSVSATRPETTHALPCARRESHAPARAGEDILFCKYLHDLFENKGDKPVAMKDEEWKKMNRKTFGLIRQYIGHEAKTSENKALLMRRLVNLKLQRETTVAEHTSEFQNLVNQLTSVDLQFDNEMQALLLMSSLLKNAQRRENGYDRLKCVAQALVSEEVGKEIEVKEEVITGVLKKDGGGHKREVALLGAFYCDQVEHIKRDCPKYKAQDQSSDTTATIVMADEDENDVLLAASEDGKSD
ncbi:C-repeat/DRE binding factor 1 [Actinidia rufa]|uniref:C-repeat/DRE binding factor 1 n=1 Tax=Actinidia rufa TaxID=165716 RepID=A0A7J0G8A9_9ERIC|nr:C-repeat/DRE binding factor 1 [Actinidia rufa]